MPKRLRHVHGTKQLPRGRECLTFRVAHDGPVIVDRVHPDDRAEMFARLWGHCGRGNVWAAYRRMGRTEQYVAMDSEVFSGMPQNDTRISAYWLHDVTNATPEGPGCPVCHANEPYDCQCEDPDYEHYMAEWQAALNAGEFDEFDATYSYFIGDMIPGADITDFVRRKAAA